MLRSLLGSAPTGTGTMALHPNFWKFYLIRTSFTFGEPVFLVKVFRLFRLEQIVFLSFFLVLVFGVYNILSIGRASVFVMPCLSYTAQSICPYSLPELRRGSSEVCYPFLKAHQQKQTDRH
jgi:hypothetical protein